MHERRLRPVLFLLCFSLFLLAVFSLAGCCGYTEAARNANGTNQTVAPPAQPVPPYVNLSLNYTEAPAPFNMIYSYSCHERGNPLVSCELRMDGRTYAKGPNQSSLFPPGHERPDFYWEILKTVGNHTLEMHAVDSKGLTSSKVVPFTVLPPAYLSKPGWYVCNNMKDTPPCDSMLAGYCDKFVETDLSVRQAAAQAISKHPGAFSINQLLDIYDWVHTNVFYQNVPIDMSPPYPPSQTLATKSGDCKNQAVLIASMVEAIGGSSRVLIAPDCHHAFAEVYMGADIDTSIMGSAIRSHYNTYGKSPVYHYSKNSLNQTEYWFIFDTAGGSYPGETIPECFNSSQTFEIRDCSRPLDQLKAPETEGTAYGPYTAIDETKVLQADGGWYYWHETGISPNGYKWCHFRLSAQSLSPTPLDWHITDEAGYQNWYNFQGYTYWGGQEQVARADYEFDWDKQGKIYLILENSNQLNSITADTQLVKTCYKG